MITYLLIILVIIFIFNNCSQKMKELFLDYQNNMDVLVKLSENKYHKFFNENFRCYELENVKLKRFGPNMDGGYILCNNILWIISKNI